MGPGGKITEIEITNEEHEKITDKDASFNSYFKSIELRSGSDVLFKKS